MPMPKDYRLIQDQTPLRLFFFSFEGVATGVSSVMVMSARVESKSSSLVVCSMILWLLFLWAIFLCFESIENSELVRSCVECGRGEPFWGLLMG